jgi:hypothetical protein
VLPQTPPAIDYPIDTTTAAAWMAIGTRRPRDLPAPDAGGAEDDDEADASGENGAGDGDGGNGNGGGDGGNGGE